MRTGKGCVLKSHSVREGMQLSNTVLQAALGLSRGPCLECHAKASDCCPRTWHGIREHAKAAIFVSRGHTKYLGSVELLEAYVKYEKRPVNLRATPSLLFPRFRISSMAFGVSAATGCHLPAATMPPSTTTKLPRRHGGGFGGVGMQRVPAGAGGKPAGGGGKRSDHAPAWYEQLIKGGGKVSYSWVRCALERSWLMSRRWWTRCLCPCARSKCSVGEQQRR